MDSPCLNICTLDAAGVFCTACLRSLDEIAQWSQLSDQARAEIMADLPRRQSDNSAYIDPKFAP